jgi:hypothetical protein
VYLSLSLIFFLFIFVIFFFVTAFVYFAGGALFLKYTKGVSGVEMIPNHEFWADLPALVRDGCAYFVLSVRRCLGQAPSETYTTMPEASPYASSSA